MMLLSYAGDKAGLMAFISRQPQVRVSEWIEYKVIEQFLAADHQTKLSMLGALKHGGRCVVHSN